MENKPIVEVKHLSHRYSVDWAIRDINLSIDSTGIMGLLGSNNFYPWQGIIGTHDWFLQTFEVKTPAEPKSNISYLAPSITGASGTVWFDDIRLEEIGDEK